MILDRHVNTVVVMGSVKDEVGMSVHSISVFYCINDISICVWVCGFVCVCVCVSKKTSHNN